MLYAKNFVPCRCTSEELDLASAALASFPPIIVYLRAVSRKAREWRCSMAIEIFCCYAHEDEPLLNKLKAQLRPLELEGLIKLWYDRDISAGTEWEHEIGAHLDTANIILLLVSPD